MRRRARLALLVLVLGLGAGLWLMFRGAPEPRTVVYDLGEAHGEVTLLLVRFVTPEEGALLRQSEWRFGPGEAPRRVTHQPALPPAPLRLEARLEGRAGVRRVTRAFDGAGPGDQVVVYLGE